MRGAVAPGGVRLGAGVEPGDLGVGILFWHIRDAAIVGEATSGRIVLWNPAAEALFGYPAAEAVGQPLEMLVPERLRGPHRAGLAAYAATGEGALIAAAKPVELPAVRRTGEEIAVELSLYPIPDARAPGRYVLALVRDATERQRVDAERAGLLATTQEYAARMEELAVLKADFTATIAHELGAPLAAIRGLADLVAAGHLPPADQAHLVAAIRVEADLLRALLADVQAAAAAERDDFTVRPRATPVATLIADAAAFARGLAGDHPLTTEVATAARIHADPDRIGQVLRNLLGNAAKHTPPGTPIEIRARPHGDRVRIEVADRGPGIDPADVTRIFEKFGRGRDARGGAVHGVGLGLYLSRRLIRAHGSELTVSTAPGAGATFAFDLEAAP